MSDHVTKSVDAGLYGLFVETLRYWPYLLGSLVFMIAMARLEKKTKRRSRRR